MKRPAFLLAGLLALLILAFASKGALVTAPDVPQSVAAGEFDTKRALVRLQRILGDQRPHAVDTAANDAVRERLVAELRAIGLAPRVTDDWACNGNARVRAVSCARVRNVVATVGPAQGRHVLVAVHYDSTFAGPGAADDGIGVASAIEIASLLKGRRLARPVSFLFDEGEEAGLLGAKAFLEHDPLAAEVDSVVNLEARGVTGPAIMFETSRPNAAAIEHFSSAAALPVANSMTADIYRLIPNSTDVTVFAARPWTMLNYAIIGNESRYHSPADRFENLDPRSLYHMGSQALAATAELSGGPVHAVPGERMYTDLLGRGMLVLPLQVGLALLGLLLAAFLWIGWRRRGGLGRSLAAVAAAVVASCGSTFLIQLLLGFARRGEYWRGHPQVIAVAVDVTAVALGVAMLALIARPVARDRLRPAYWLVLLLLAVFAAFVAPGASVFFLIPPATAAAGMALRRRLASAERVAALLAWAAFFLTVAPLLHLGEVLLDFANGWIFALFAALVALPVLIELKPLLNRVSKTALISTSGTMLLVAWATVAIAPAYTPDRKQLLRIDYTWDQDKDNGLWSLVTDDGRLPAGFAAFRHWAELPWSTAKRLVAPAPPVRLAAPSLERIGERRSPQGRVVRLRLSSGGADAVLLIARPEAALLAVGVPGSSARFGKGSGKDPFVLRCGGRSCDGLVFDLALRGQAQATLVGIRPGLPDGAAPLLKSRPANAGPQYSPDQSYSVTRAAF